METIVAFVSFMAVVAAWMVLPAAEIRAEAVPGLRVSSEAA